MIDSEGSGRTNNEDETGKSGRDELVPQRKDCPWKVEGKKRGQWQEVSTIYYKSKECTRGKNSLHGRSVRCESQSRAVDSVGSKRFTILRLFHLGAEERNSLSLRMAPRGGKMWHIKSKGSDFLLAFKMSEANASKNNSTKHSPLLWFDERSK